MPILSYFVGVGAMLVALLFVADLALPKSDAPVIATSSLYGLPKPWKPDPARAALLATPAPAPDMASEAVQAAMTKTEPVIAGNARAEAAPKKKKKHIARRQPRPSEFGQNYAWSPNAGRPFGGSGFFGRF
jgi:hypothetical protein